MSQPYAWNKLRSSPDSAKISSRSGHSLTKTGSGIFCFGGVDGKRDNLGNSVPTRDLYELKLSGGMRM
jgi:hypothetical protein